MTLKLRKCTSEPTKLTKSFVSGADLDLTGTLRESADVLSPVIKIESSSDLSQYNYCEITDFGRKYFCKVRALQYNLWEISCEVDVLSTYETQIKNLKAIVKRTKDNTLVNYFMNDGAFFTEQRTVTTYHAPKNQADGTIPKFSNWYYYLIVAGGYGS